MFDVPASRRHSVKLHGSDVHYWVYGPNRGAPVIIAVHGFRGTHHGLEQVIAALPQYTVIVPDLPGFGESTPMDGTHDINGYATLLRDFIPIVTRPNEPVYLLGHSFGSIVAAKLAADADIHFNGLILVNPIAKRPQFFGRLLTKLYFTVGERLSEQGARRYFGWPVAVNTMSFQLTKSIRPSMRRYIKNQHLAHFTDYADKRTLHESFIASISRTVSEKASWITVPTLLIAGSRDVIAPLKSQYALYRQMRVATELAVIPHVGHLVHYEKPADVAAFVTAFIEE